MDWKAIVGRNVRRLRQERKLSQEQLALSAGIDLAYVGGIELGKRNPSLLILVRLSTALETTPSKLLEVLP